MQLSIEAIIILVIAIVLLGLGIAFIKNFFGTGTEALMGSFDPIKEQCDVSPENPVVPRELRIEQGKEEQVKICVYNNQATVIKNAEIRFLQCKDPLGNPVGSPTTATQNINSGLLKLSTLGQDIARGETKGYKALLSSNSANIGTFICNMEVSCASGCPTVPTGAQPPKIPVQMAIKVE